MLDPKNSWQCANGGWWQSNETEYKPGLWASIYAAKLLQIVCSTGDFARPQQNTIAAEALRRTVQYFANEWKENRWSEPGKLSMEENVVAMFIELAPILDEHEPRLHLECVEAMKTWVTPGGDLSKEYLRILDSQKAPVLAEQAYARMAYAFYLSNDETIDWRPWFQKAARASANRLFSTEWAFVLDLSFAARA